MPSPAYSLVDEVGTRPGRDTVLGAVIRWTFITVSLVFLAALLFAAAGVAHHIWQQRTRRGSESSAAIESAEESDLEVKR